MSDLSDWANEYANWAEKTFPEGTAESGWRHLQKEMEHELLPAATYADAMEEASDCLLLLLFIARKKGLNVAFLAHNAHEKFKINKSRAWGQPNANGFREHVK